MKKLFAIVICCAAIPAIAQQDPLYSQYINNPFVLNPAYAGLTNNLNASISYRKQWAGFEGSPTTVNANGHLSLFNNKMGLGLMVVSDKIGTTSVTEAYSSYAYRIRVTSHKTLSFGLQAGLINYHTENDELNLQNPGDPLFSGEPSQSKPSMGAGVILTSQKFFFGLSVPRMLPTKMSTGGFKSTPYTQHFYAMGSYLFFINEHLRFRPSVLAKVVSGAPASIDLNAALIIHENYTAGLLTRDFSTYGFFLQALIKDSFRFGYAFEMPTNQSVGTNFPTHEITLGVWLNVLSFHSTSGVTSF